MDDTKKSTRKKSPLRMIPRKKAEAKPKDKKSSKKDRPPQKQKDILMPGLRRGKLPDFGDVPMTAAGGGMMKSKMSTKGGMSGGKKKAPGMKAGGKFPDLSGDGKVTQKDILMGKGVIKKKGGGKVKPKGAAAGGGYKKGGMKTKTATKKKVSKAKVRGAGIARKGVRPVKFR